MRLITIDSVLIHAYHDADDQVLLKEKRPVALIARLAYKGDNVDFAIPFRSNIPPAAPLDEYFALPPRDNTKKKYRHGLHYIKMIPVSSKFFVRYRIEGDIASKMYLAIINKNEKRIINECQNYLNNYSSVIKSVFSTNIDRLIDILKEKQ